MKPQITQMDADKNIRGRETCAIIWTTMAVHNELGNGFVKAVYQAEFICFDSVIV